MKRRRQTKHRGNAAGVVVARGRTGRRRGAAARGDAGSRAAQGGGSRAQRYDRPPTWRGAFVRALVAAAVVLIVSLLILRTKPVQAIVLFPVVTLVYVPMSYYTDLWLYRRRLRRKGQGRGAVGT